MKHYIGLDVSMKETSLCVVNESGKRIVEQIVITEPKAIADYIRTLQPYRVDRPRIGIFISLANRRADQRRFAC